MEDINQNSGDMVTEDHSVAGNQDAQLETATDAPAQTSNDPSGTEYSRPVVCCFVTSLFSC